MCDQFRRWLVVEDGQGCQVILQASKVSECFFSLFFLSFFFAIGSTCVVESEICIRYQTEIEPTRDSRVDLIDSSEYVFFGKE